MPLYSCVRAASSPFAPSRPRGVFPPRFPRINPGERAGDVSEIVAACFSRSLRAQSAEIARGTYMWHGNRATRYNAAGRRERRESLKVVASRSRLHLARRLFFPSPLITFSSRVHNAAAPAPLPAALITPCMHNKEETLDGRHPPHRVCRLPNRVIRGAPNDPRHRWPARSSCRAHLLSIFSYPNNLSGESTRDVVCERSENSLAESRFFVSPRIPRGKNVR